MSKLLELADAFIKAIEEYHRERGAIEYQNKIAQVKKDYLSYCDDNPQAVAELCRENERLRYALKIIAGEEQCLDNFMSNLDVAKAALKTMSTHKGETNAK